VNDGARNPAPAPAAGGAKDQVTLYELVGGAAWFEALVDRFYDGVAADPVLRPLYPEQDLTGARRRLCGFLVQYWGGPDDYSRARGYPRLRMRHNPYPIDAPAQRRWLHHMRTALAAADLPEEVAPVVEEYFERASVAMINQEPAL
jgi:hemoglobin